MGGDACVAMAAAAGAPVTVEHSAVSAAARNDTS